MTKEYRKTYRPFIVWILLLFTVLLVAGILPAPFVSGETLTRLTVIATLIMLDVLMIIIYRGEYVYWINGGPSFEQARDAGSAARKAYALAHLKPFLWATLIAAVLMTASALLNWPVWIDALGACAALVTAALSTVRIKFSK